MPDRNVLAGIVFMLLSSCSWANLPARQLGCGSPVTCWRRVRDWQQAGVWERLHQVLLAELRRTGRLDLSPLQPGFGQCPSFWSWTAIRCTAPRP